MKKYQNFLSEKLPFLVVIFSVNLNRRVFIMSWTIQNARSEESDQTARTRRLI